MLRRYLLRFPDGALAPTGGGTSGAGAPSGPTASAPLPFATLLAQREGAPAAATEPSQPGPATEPPAASDDPPADPNAPGQDPNLSPEEPPPAGDEPAPGGEPANEPLTEEPAAEPEETEATQALTQALAKLSPKEREALLELSGQLQPGEIPRIGKLVSQLHQQEELVEKQAKRIEELEAGGGNTQPSTFNPQPVFPKAIAELKTVEAVHSRIEAVEENIQAINDYLDANPGPSDTVYQITADKQMTRQQLIEARSSLRSEAKLLPQREKQLVAHEQFTAARRQADAQARKDFPVLSDPENADNKLARQMLSNPKLAGEVHGEYMALAMAVGHRVLQAELAAKGKAKVAPVLKTPPPAGKIPTGKPHTSVGTAPTRTNGHTAAAALSRLEKDRSPDASLAFIGASGR